MCPETQLNAPEPLGRERDVPSGSREAAGKERLVTASKEVGSGDVTERKARPSSFLSSIQVSCPLCDQGFPPAKIELHAMYCNGLAEQDTVLTRRQREARNRSLGEAADDKNEKCYLCQARVPFRDYHSHVMACLRLTKKAASSRAEASDQWQRPGSAAEGKQPSSRLQGHPKKKGCSESRLLHLLEQSEHQTADAEAPAKPSGPGSGRVPSSGMEEAGFSREKPSPLSPPSLAESPIKSFVPISEATDCLVDFKKQLTAMPRGQPRTRGCRGRRKKS